jgi:hypothetical protein
MLAQGIKRWNSLRRVFKLPRLNLVMSIHDVDAHSLQGIKFRGNMYDS